MNRKEYRASVKENEHILRRFPNSLGDRALYRIGLIYVHPENEAANEQRALKAFKKIVDDYPVSPLRERARVWVLVITNMWRDEKVIRELNEKISQLRKRDAKRREKIHVLNAAQGDSEEIIKQLQHRIAALETEIRDMKSQMEKLKKIDLRIEEKKRELFP